eukprot:230090_1
MLIAEKPLNLPLSKRFTADLCATLVAGFALTWLITPMDAAVTTNMSGKSTILRSLGDSFKEIGTRPHRYLRRPEFGIVFGVISSTYLAKNGSDSYCAFHNMSNERTAFIKFWTVFAVNGSLCVFWRDPQFAKIFGTKAPSRVPVVSYFFWFSRDVFHALGAVVAPDYVEKKYSLTTEQWRYCQLSFPLLIQVATTPCHLIGLDFYNIKESTLMARMGRTVKAWGPSFAVRCVRMFPPWSVGLVANRQIREYIMGHMDE